MINEILDSFDLLDFELYLECIKGKQTYIRRLGVERYVLELIHIDICEPFSIASWNSQQYFITFINDFSCYRYLYLIHEKSQALDVFKVFKPEVENQLNKND